MTARRGPWMLWALCAAMAACTAAPDDPCELETAGGYPKDHPVCLFYTGTDHYRNERYAEAHAAWQALVTLPAVDDDSRPLLADAQNNLGYLLFNGLGGDQDRARAIELWRSAAAAGNAEAEYHLCHGYIDAAKPLGDPVAAARHCALAQALYQGIAERNEGQERILADVEKYRAIAEKAAARALKPAAGEGEPAPSGGG